MDKIKKISVIEYTIISILWVLIFITPVLFGNEFDKRWNAIYTIWIEYSLIFIIFAVNRFILMPRFFLKNKFKEYLFWVLILLSTTFILVTYGDIVDKILNYITGETSDIPRYSIRKPAMPSGDNIVRIRRHISLANPIPMIPPFLNMLVLFILTIGLDIGLILSLKWLQSQKQQAEQKSENVSIQLAQLQSQISPHFFMNTLNNIHALVAIDPDKAQDTIIKLSHLMDYLLYETTSVQVSIKKELEFTRNYVNLMKLRYSNRVTINLNIDENIPKVKVPPLLFLNFIENAFKHGISYTEKSYIKIAFLYNNDMIELDVENSDFAKISSKNQGLGISNIEKRLRLLYKDRHKLKINKDNNIFRVNLKIPISL
ncbi:MAG: histidine kinase [Rikenellaceae bacterium]